MLITQPITINGMTLKNRVIMAPMLVGPNITTPQAIAYHLERAKGGVSAIICGIMMVGSLISDKAWGQIGARDVFIQGLGKLVEEIHRAGAKIGLQISHPSYLPDGIHMVAKEGKLIAPSHRIEPNPSRHSELLPGAELQELTIFEIEEIIHKYAQGAAVTREVGFDFVELHCAHGHFNSSFFSPIENQRADKYGGSLKGRMRFVLESLMAMRQAAGSDFPIFIRMGAEDQDILGVKLEEAVEFAAAAEKAGADVIDVSVSSLAGAHPLPDQPMGTYAYLAEAVKKRVNVPVVAVGRVNTAEVAEAILRDSKADLVALGRQLIADPHWVDKVLQGNSEDIIPCLSCMHCHGVTIHKQQPLECAVNPKAGRESEFEILPARKPKQILVIGSGPAGIEAALVATWRGHRVTLIEKANDLGGQLLYARIPPYKEPIENFREYLVRQLKKSGVTVKTGNEATAESIIEANPDAVIVATGAKPTVPDIPGVQGKNVLTALQILEGKPVGKRVIVVGGGIIGCETALFLAKKNKDVKILEMLDSVGIDYDDAIPREKMLEHLQAAGVEIITGAKVLEITKRGVTAERSGTSQGFEADNIVLAVGMLPDQELNEQLVGKVKALYSVGDCANLGKIAGAVYSGARVASEL